MSAGDVITDYVAAGTGEHGPIPRTSHGMAAGIIVSVAIGDAVVDMAAAGGKRERVPPQRRRPRDGRGDLRLRGQVRADGRGA